MVGQVLLQALEGQSTVAVVRLSHLGKFNAMSRSMWRSLAAVFAGLSARCDLRAVILTGEGEHFCAGGDIAEYPDFRFEAQSLSDFHEQDVWGGLSAVRACPVPVIAAIDGNCMGAGLELASCCDIRLAGASARFGAPIARLGFPMAPREAQLVVGAVGVLTAREMLLEAAVLPAPDMKARGFLNRVVADGQVWPEAVQCAVRVARLAPQTARTHKQLLSALAAGMADVQPLVATAYEHASSDEHREGIAAFLGKRQPAF